MRAELDSSKVLEQIIIFYEYRPSILKLLIASTSLLFSGDIFVTYISTLERFPDTLLGDKKVNYLTFIFINIILLLLIIDYHLHQLGLTLNQNFQVKLSYFGCCPVLQAPVLQVLFCRPLCLLRSVFISKSKNK